MNLFIQELTIVKNYFKEKMKDIKFFSHNHNPLYLNQFLTKTYFFPFQTKKIKHLIQINFNVMMSLTNLQKHPYFNSRFFPQLPNH